MRRTVLLLLPLAGALLMAACGDDDDAPAGASGDPSPTRQAEESTPPTASGAGTPGAATGTTGALTGTPGASPTLRPATQQPTPATQSQGGQPVTTASPAAAATPTPTPAPASGRGPQSPDPLFQYFVDAAAADLATRLGIGVGAIKLDVAKAVTWNDGSMGCPVPGMVYIQAVQDGVFVRLLANGKAWPYHQGGLKPIFLCEKDVG